MTGLNDRPLASLISRRVRHAFQRKVHHNLLTSFGNGHVWEPLVGGSASRSHHSRNCLSRTGSIVHWPAECSRAGRRASGERIRCAGHAQAPSWSTDAELVQQCPLVQELNIHKRATAPEVPGYASQVFETLFPGTPIAGIPGPAVNALLATLYISGPPSQWKSPVIVRSC